MNSNILFSLNFVQNTEERTAYCKIWRIPICNRTTLSSYRSDEESNYTK